MNPATTITATSLLAQEDGQELLLLGDDFMPWMVLAFGAALVVGNLLALVRPPGGSAAKGAGEPSLEASGDRPRPPLVRTLVMVAVGLLAAIWGLASLLR